MIYCAAVEKIEKKRKPEDFFGHRKRDKLSICVASVDGCAAVEKIEEKRKPEDFFGHRGC